MVKEIFNTFGYDPSGEKIDIDIIDGLSFLDGTYTRVAEGTTVQTGGGIYKLVKGVGTLVTQHNQQTNIEVGNKYLSNIPFTGNGALAGGLGEYIKTLTNYLTGTITDAQAESIAKQSILVDESIAKLIDEKIENAKNTDSGNVVDNLISTAVENMQSNNWLEWVNKNKIWVFGSLAALVGIVILDD